MQNLDDLVLQAEDIATNLEEDEIPHVQRNIEQLRKRGETFYNRAAQNDIKAAKLLGNKVGYELSAGLSKTLESLHVVSSYDGLSGINIEDIPSFLKNERESAILSSINLTRNNTLNISYKLCEKAKTEWWKSEKNNILNLLVNSDKLPNLLPTGLVKNTHIAIEENPRFIKTILSREELQYARQIGIYVNNVRQRNELSEDKSLLNLLLQSESSPINHTRYPELMEISRLLMRICEFQPICSPFELSNIRENDSELSKEMVEANLCHLENEYWIYIRQFIQEISSVNIIRSVEQTLAAYVENQLLSQFDGGCLEDETVMGVPVWPLIFVCLRSGHHKEAISIARQAASNLGEFHEILELWWTAGTLSVEQTRKLATEYKRHVRASSDGWKRLVYCLIAGCDIDDVHKGVLTTVDDFIWLHLAHLRRSNALQEEQQQQQKSRFVSTGTQLDQYLSIGQLQKLITEEYGETHFCASKHPLTYFRVLLLCQMFEPALAFLARFEHLRCHAVHLALVLWRCNLLLVSNNIEAPLLGRNEDDPQGLLRLNLMRLVTLYTRKFELNHPKEALDLFYILSDLPGHQDDINGFVTCASSLAVESGQLESLFSRVFDDDGVMRQGLLSRYGNVAEPILEAVSKRFRQAGRSESACDALQLAGRFNEAAADLAELLANAISSRSNSTNSTNNPDISRLQAKADFLLERMREISSDMRDCQESSLLSCILTIGRFITSSEEGDIEAALAALDRTHLLPTSSDSGTIRSAIESFRNLPELVRSMFPVLLVSAMRTFREAARHRQYSQDYLAEIRGRAGALITFTGQLPYRMPSEVYANLSQLELDIN